jgi:hypothetical protein
MPTNLIPIALIIIVAHVVTSGFYLTAQMQLTPYQPVSFLIFGVLVMIAGPLVAGMLVCKHCYAMGAALLVSSLLGAAILGTSRFILGDIASPHWLPVTHQTANLLLLIEGIGCWVSWRLL